MFVYITTNLINGKRYIGKTIKDESDPYLGSGTYFSRALKKYGRQNFQRTILEHAKSEDELFELEKKYIQEYNAVEDPNFYNLHEGGKGGNTGNYEEVSRKVSGESNPMHGRAFSKEHREKISKAIKNWSLTEPADLKKSRLDKISRAQKNKPKNPSSVEKMKRTKALNPPPSIPQVLYEVVSPSGETFRIWGKRALTNWCKERGFSIWIMDHYLLCGKEAHHKNPLHGWKAKSHPHLRPNI